MASSSTVMSEYSLLVESGAIHKDEGQERLAAALTDLQGRLSVWSGIRGALGFDASVAAWRISRIGGAGGRQGIYMSGGVGVGKSMMMDMLYEAAATDLKRRAHFHSFMLDVHRRVHALRQVAGPGVDPIKSVARSIARNTVLLCFDEFQVKSHAHAKNQGFQDAKKHKPPPR
jgi:predicted ATPase